MVSKLHHALAAAAQGFKAFPLTPGAKAPPLISDWPNKATTDTKQIEAWWKQWPDANIGIHCEGLAVVDVDTKKQASEFGLKQMGESPATRVHRTPSGGAHVIFRHAEGVANGVDVLGPGYDLRSNHGYILGPGSSLPAGDYTVEDFSPIANAPAWLIEKCKAAPKVKAESAPVPDAPAGEVQRALDWLKRQEEAVEGQGGDHRTYAVACGLRDLGVSQGQAFELMRDEFNHRCAPPWSMDDLYRKVVNAFDYAQNAPGTASVSAVAEMMGVPQSEAPSAAVAAVALPATTSGILLRRARTLTELNPGLQLWDGVLTEKAVFALGALPGRSKSYTVTGLCYALATDAGHYLGRAIPKGTTACYVDVERLAMTELRVATWCGQDGRDPATLPLLMTGGLRLSDPSTVEQLIVAIRAQQLNRRVSLVIIDSLGAALPGQEMNNSGPATLAGTQLRRIRDSLNCAVGVIAHSPKSGEETVAGSMHFDAIFDTTVFVRSETGQYGSLYVKKDNALALDEHERHTHWRAETVTAQLGERTVKVHRLVEGEAVATQAKDKLRGHILAGWQVLCEITGDSNAPVTRKAWRDACYTEFLEDNRNKAQRFLDIRRNLLRRNYISDNDGVITRKCE